MKVNDPPPRRKQLGRRVGAFLIVAGLLLLVWSVVVWQWQDPFTALYTRFKQRALASAYSRLAADPHFHVPRARQHGHLTATTALQALRPTAAAYRRSLQPGKAVGRLTIGRIGLNMIVVEGTDHNSLRSGPGHYPQSELPGQGGLIYVAGHRTTYLAPFAQINDIRNGDYITFKLPYGTFTYRAYRHYIVAASDIALLKNTGHEILRLQACHPRFFATHRYIVDAALTKFTLNGGAATYALARTDRLGQTR